MLGRARSVGLCALLTFLVTASLEITNRPGTAEAAGGLDVSSSSTYTIDPTSGSVYVRTDLSLRNTLPDQVSDGVINRRYFAAVSLPVPIGAANPTATNVATGASLAVSPAAIPDSADYFLYRVTLERRLYFGETSTITVSYELTGQPPRSANPSRVNEAYASFRAIGVGDSGKVTVRIVVPPGFTSDTFGSNAVVTTEDGNTVFTATDIETPDQFGIFVSARNDDRLIETEITTLSGAEFKIRAWPGDAEWQAFVTEQIKAGVPVLSSLVGQPWPIGESVEVREAFTPYLYGYAGWFSARRNELEIGEDLDPVVILHELSHAWFNDEWFSQRWISEGFAQLYASRAAAVIGGVTPDVDEVEVNDPARIPLNDWGDPSLAGDSEGADDVERYAYNASWAVVREIATEVGDDAMKEILDTIEDSTTAYRGDDPPEQITTRTDWRRFLDLAEELGNSGRAQELFAQFVVTEADLQLLARRTSARSSYQALVMAGRSWAPPRVVRERMASWEFSEAERLISESLEILSKRDALAITASVLGINYPESLEILYEAANGQLGDIDIELQAQISAADALLAASQKAAESNDLFERIGLIGTNLSAKIQAAKSSFSQGDTAQTQRLAEQIIDQIEEAEDTGKRRTLLAGSITLAFIVAVTTSHSLRRRRRQHSSEIES